MKISLLVSLLISVLSNASLAANIGEKEQFCQLSGEQAIAIAELVKTGHTAKDISAMTVDKIPGNSKEAKITKATLARVIKHVVLMQYEPTEAAKNVYLRCMAGYFDIAPDRNSK